MDFTNETWTIANLFELYESRRLELNPPYQRNPIWSTHAQQELIETVVTRKPMPCFFIWSRPDGIFEVVDGKQRAITIFAFLRGHLSSFSGEDINSFRSNNETKRQYDNFIGYPLSITLITALSEGEVIEKFYALVNKTGLRLNSPELRKAEFYTTNLLRLVTNLASLDEFKRLGLFTRLSTQRMNDVDFVSELIAQMHLGITDKKERVDDLYDTDITEEQFAYLRQSFLHVLAVITNFEKIVPISKTRYRQKNDFYTLFGFIYRNPRITQTTFDLFYKVLARIGPYIRPSQEECKPLMDYALNCVTQSNSKKAREERLRFFDLLLLNREDQANTVQTSILGFFKLGADGLARVGEFTTLDPNKLRDPDQIEITYE